MNIFAEHARTASVVYVLNYFFCMFKYFKFMKIKNDPTKVIKHDFSKSIERQLSI